ncbi:MAG: septal ring lytic transglycosylase RlpA family protein [Flavisolibacter sp.]
MRFQLLLIATIFCGFATAQVGSAEREKFDTPETKEVIKKTKTIYGVASYYADKFNGRETANGEIYDGKKLTAACNQLPLGTWIRVTNLNNNRSVVVKTNDRLHIRMKRVVDLSRAAAETLGYIGRGLTNVKVEVLEKKQIDSTN